MTVTRTHVARERYPPGWLTGQLPLGMQDDDLLIRFTTIFEQLGATLREGADGVEHAADATVTSPGMLDYLGRWIGYDVLDERLPVERQRRIVRALGRALPLRGTATGLRILLEAVTAARVEITEPGAVRDDEQSFPEPGPILVRLASTGHLREHELAALVRDEVPTHLPVRIEVDPSLGEEQS